MARVNLRNGREISHTRQHRKFHLRRSLHQGIGSVVCTLFAGYHIHIILAQPSRSRDIELTYVSIYRGRRTILLHILTLIRLHRHRAHHTIIQPAAQRNKQCSARSVGILIGSRLRNNLNLRYILGTKVLHIVNQRLTREFDFAIIDKEFRAR